ncbi:MAG: hypothetical protein GY722_07255 [bacterium]|nr:hypothetical protein [bacterium]
MLELDRTAADVAPDDPILVDETTFVTGHRLLERVIGHDLGRAVRAGHAQVLKTLERAALALPIADRVLHEIERARFPEIREREDAGEDRLQPMAAPFLREEIHLQETFVRPALNVDQIRDRQRRADFREVFALGGRRL